MTEVVERSRFKDHASDQSLVAELHAGEACIDARTMKAMRAELPPPKETCATLRFVLLILLILLAVFGFCLYT